MARAGLGGGDAWEVPPSPPLGLVLGLGNWELAIVKRDLLLPLPSTPLALPGLDPLHGLNLALLDLLEVDLLFEVDAGHRLGSGSGFDWRSRQHDRFSYTFLLELKGFLARMLLLGRHGRLVL